MPFGILFRRQALTKICCIGVKPDSVTYNFKKSEYHPVSEDYNTIDCIVSLQEIKEMCVHRSLTLASRTLAVYCSVVVNSYFTYYNMRDFS